MPNRLSWIVGGVLSGLLLLGLPKGAEALSLYTLDSSVAINEAGVVGSIDPVTDFSGTGGPAGSVDAFVFDISITSATTPVGSIGVAIPTATTFGVDPIGAGAYTSGPGVAPTSTSADPFNFVVTGVCDGCGGYVYGSGLGAGDTSVRLWVTFTAGNLANALGVGNGVNFMISSGGDFTVQGTVAVPEPSTLLLVLLGAGALAAGALPRRTS